MIFLFEIQQIRFVRANFRKIGYSSGKLLNVFCDFSIHKQKCLTLQSLEELLPSLFDGKIFKGEGSNPCSDL
jgi:hypothetical protein